MADEESQRFMRRAIELARQGMRAGNGGPFGAVIVRGGEIIGEGWNRVLLRFDPTAHGEVEAIRDATSRIRNKHLENCDIYTSAEPCPMCLGAIYWARIGRIFYAASAADTASVGFDDQNFYREFALAPDKRRIPAARILSGEGVELFREFVASPLYLVY